MTIERRSLSRRMEKGSKGKQESCLWEGELNHGSLLPFLNYWPALLGLCESLSSMSTPFIAHCGAQADAVKAIEEGDLIQLLCSEDAPFIRLVNELIGHGDLWAKKRNITNDTLSGVV